MARKPCGLSIKLIPFWSAITHARNRRRVLRCLVLHSIAILSLPFEACKSGIEYLCDCFCVHSAPWLTCVTAGGLTVTLQGITKSYGLLSTSWGAKGQRSNGLSPNCKNLISAEMSQS